MLTVLLNLNSSSQTELINKVLTKIDFEVHLVNEKKESVVLPDVVITNNLGDEAETLTKFIQLRENTGKPKFIWVGESEVFSQLSSIKKSLVDTSIDSPVKPDELILAVCELMQLDKNEYQKRYLQLFKCESSQERSQRQDSMKAAMDNIEAKEDVLDLKSMSSLRQVDSSDESLKQLELKRKFIKNMFKD